MPAVNLQPGDVQIDAAGRVIVTNAAFAAEIQAAQNPPPPVGLAQTGAPPADVSIITINYKCGVRAE